MSYRVKAKPCEGINGACNGRCESRDEISDATSKPEGKVVVLLVDQRDYMRRDECVELTFSAGTDRNGWRLTSDAIGLRILDGDGNPVARELSQHDRVSAEFDAEDILDRSDVFERWDAEDLEDYQLACVGL